MAAEYGLRAGSVWAIGTDEPVTPRQILDLIGCGRRNEGPVMVGESNVDPRALETVSRETGIPIFGMIYSEELGAEEGAGGTFLGMLAWNLKTIYSGLAGE